MIEVHRWDENNQKLHSYEAPPALGDIVIEECPENAPFVLATLLDAWISGINDEPFGNLHTVEKFNGLIIMTTVLPQLHCRRHQYHGLGAKEKAEADLVEFKKRAPL